MATTVQKITLSSSRDIPFNKLILSQANVRRVKAGVSIEELAEDIGRRTLLQGLSVRPVLDAEGAETGMFEIPAGGRRYRALELLVKQKRLAKTAPVPCVVRDPGTDILAEDDSLAENIQRAPLHPLDQFRAFQALREKGRSEEDIAAAFFVGVNVVKQRLRLASVSPTLLEVYAEDGMSLEQLMAFTVSADHARQEQVWQAISGSWQKEPYQIRRMLTEKTVRASDRRAVFVGLDAYEAAGGVVLRDLFQSDDGGWLEDIALLDGLVAEKLKAEAETIAAEGWKWIEVAIDFPYGHDRGLRALEGVAVDLTGEEQATIDALNAEYAKLEAEHDGADELPDEVDERLGEIEVALAAFDDRPVTYDSVDIARAGVFVSIGAEGTLSVDRGYVRPQDEAPVGEPEQDGEVDPATASANHADPDAPVVQRAVITVGGQVAGPEDEDDEDLKPLPDRLLAELTAERTLALRDKLATTPAVAFQAVLHKFCLDVFSRYFSYGTAMEFLSYDDPRWMGGLGMIGTKPAFRAVQDCDLLLMLGTDYPYSNFLPSDGDVIQIDERASAIGRRTPTALGVIGSVKPTLAALLEKIERRSDSDFFDSVSRGRREWDEMLSKQSDLARSRDKIHPQAVARSVSDIADENAVFVFDTGLNTLWSANWLRQNGKQRIVGSFNNAAVGTAVGQANGIQALDRARQVIVLTGDGGFNMLMGEFLTAVHHDLPVKFVIFDNAAFGLITLEAESVGILPFKRAIEFPNPDYPALARACGAQGFVVDNPMQLEATLREAFALSGPAVIACKVVADEMPNLPHFEPEQLGGFAIAKIKEAISAVTGG
jgi:ParB family chromosome partitioning protein